MAVRCGALAEIYGLRHQPALNGQVGSVQHWLEDKARFLVILARGNAQLWVKPTNLKPYTFDIEAVGLTAIACWPMSPPIRAERIQMQMLRDWPQDDWTTERSYLRKELVWRNPQLLGGITSRGQAKPDFMMYYDAYDCVSPVNTIAEHMASLVPIWELRKASAPTSGYRGVCVLVYSPTTGSLTGPNFSSGMFASSLVDATFTAAQLREVLHYQTTSAAAAMYQRHQDPMHCVFGGLLPGFMS